MQEPLFFRQFNYNRDRLPNDWLAGMEEGVSDIRGAQRKTGKTIGYPGWLVLYSIILSHLRPDQKNTIVETGTNIGCSSIMLAQALIDSGTEGLVHTMEIDPAIADQAAQNFEEAGVSQRIKLYTGDAKQTLKEIVPTLETIRCAFLDGSHDESDVLEEFELVEPKLDPGAIVFFDNTYQIADPGEDQRVNGAMRKIKQIYGGNFVNLEFVSWFTPGLALWQRETFTLRETVRL